MEARTAIDHAKGQYAFDYTASEYDHSPLHAQLLWHFAYWKLRRLREARGGDPRQILPPGQYRNVAVLLADMCSFSSYMRDTSDPALVRDSLTAFYSRARYQIINNGGMLYQFVGDEVIGLFGIPDSCEDCASVALETAHSLLSIGQSVALHWQRHLDRVQPSAGLHIGIAVGDLQIVSLRPFSRTHIGALGDCINLAARLMSLAGQNEIVATTGVHRQLREADQQRFVRADAVELKNVGKIQAWKLPALA
jgi:class 3 adenylate cyclase